MNYRFTAAAHPEADGRKPQCGDTGYDLLFHLEGKGQLVVRMGEPDMRNLFEMLEMAKADGYFDVDPVPPKKPKRRRR